MMRPLFSRCTPLRAAAPQRSQAPLASWLAARRYSITPEAASDTELQGIDASKLVIQKASTPRALKKPEDLVFGQNFTRDG